VLAAPEAVYTTPDSNAPSVKHALAAELLTGLGQVTSSGAVRPASKVSMGSPGAVASKAGRELNVKRSAYAGTASRNTVRGADKNLRILIAFP